jgi:hypothetical protein
VKNTITELERARIIYAMGMINRRLPGDIALLYRQLYGKTGNSNEIQALRNRLNPNRSNPSLSFVGQLVNQVPALRDLTLGDLFSPPAQPDTTANLAD